MHAADPRVQNDDLVRYTVQSSDVLSDMRLNVLQEGTEKVLWYKERYLAEDEIVENVVDNVTSTIQWTIHKPVQGWYIRLRSPSFPPGSFISLTPAPSSSPYHSDAALVFSCRTNVPSSVARRLSARRSLDSDATLTSDAAVHSYPPTPPQNPVLRVSPPSPRSVQAKLSELSSPFPEQQITPFILTPHSHAHIPEQKELSVFARMMSALKNTAPSHSSSFTLSPLPNATSTPSSSGPSPSATPVPLLTYHDRTPAWKVSSTQGTLEMDTQQERDLGVHPSFYIAVALAYLDFLTERESYLAAAAD